jgi:hypothetical protein
MKRERNQIKFGLKKEEHVPRHIELTAVLKEISKQIIRVIESTDLKKPLDL